MKFCKLAPIVLALPLFFSSACAPNAADDEENLDTAESDLSVSQRTRLKAEIRAISRANQTRTDNAAEVRAQLEPLVKQLERGFIGRSAARKKGVVVGTWYQLWSDLPIMSSFFNSTDLSQIYQVVTADGYYYNLSDGRSFGLLPTTGVLRGAYKPEGNLFRIRFTNVGYQFGKLSRGQDLMQYAKDLNSGEESIIGLPSGGNAPRGPVNITGALITAYADADIRIERGFQDDFKGEDGTVLVPGRPSLLFVLDKTTSPLK
jgi:hypothetical protein